jgi:DNA-binding YbaB/EbfC family protein
MKGFPGGMQQFLKQANQLQGKVKKAQEDLHTREFEATSGGQAVRVVVTGANAIKTLVISDEVMKSGDVEMLQDLIMTAANEALKKAQETTSAEMDKLTGGMSIPGMF